MTVNSNKTKRQGVFGKDTIAKEFASSTEAMLAEMATRQFEQIFGSVDRVLSPNVDTLKVDPEEGSSPGRTDGATIRLNPAALPPLRSMAGQWKDESIMAWMGVNAHEIAHTMYTPRTGCPLHHRITAVANTASNLPTVLNMVECQRSERLIIAQYRPMLAYLTAASTTWLDFQLGKADTVGLGEYWPLLAGRTWLDPGVRGAALDAYNEMANLNTGMTNRGEELADLIGQYQRLYDPGVQQSHQAFDLLMEILRRLNTDGVLRPEDVRECSHARMAPPGGLPSEGEDTPAYTEDTEVPSAGSPEDQSNLDGPDSPEQGDGQGDGQPTKSQGQGKGQGQGQGGSDDQGQPGQGGGDSPPGQQKDSPSGGDFQKSADNQPDGDSNQQGGSFGKQAGTAKRDLVKSASQAQAQLQNQARAEARKSKAAKQELDDLRSALTSLSGLDSAVSKANDKVTMQAVTQPMMEAAELLTNHFRDFTDRALPYWERRVDSGKLNVRRYLTAESFDFETMFDRFSWGQQDDMSLDVTVLIDVSSSMLDNIYGNGSSRGGPTSLVHRAWEAAWIIRRAVQQAEGDVSVYAYNGASYVIATPDVPALAHEYETRGAEGGTDPTEALKETLYRLDGVEAAHKIVVCVTDGEWAGGGQIVNSLNQRGVVTMGVILSHEVTIATRDSNNRRLAAMGTLYNVVITDPVDMVGVFEELAGDRLAEVAIDRGWH